MGTEGFLVGVAAFFDLGLRSRNDMTGFGLVHGARKWRNPGNVR